MSHKQTLQHLNKLLLRVERQNKSLLDNKQNTFTENEINILNNIYEKIIEHLNHCILSFKIQMKLEQ